VPGSSTSVSLPLVEGSYLAKWIDSSGNQSPDAVIITTDAPSVIALNFIEDAAEVGFLGVKTNTAVLDGALTLDSENTIEEQPGNVSTWPILSALGGIAPSGNYLFDESIDLGSVQTSRVTTAINVTAFDADDLVSSRLLLSEWTSIAGDIIDDVDATIYVRTSTDNITFWKL